MKTNARMTTILLVAGIVMSASLLAQPRNGRGYGPGFDREPGERFNRLERIIPDLTEEQKDEIRDLRTAHMKELLPLRNQMGEIRARQRTLMSEVPVDQKAVEKLIDEKTAMMNTMMKTRTDHKVAIRNVLTEEQQVYLNQIPRWQRGKQAARWNRAGRYRGNPGAAYGAYGRRGYYRW